MDCVAVGNAGNAADNTGYGSVSYEYQIGKYEVTNAQYAEFLNAVAAADPSALYSTSMGGGWNDIGGITRGGSDGSYTYTVRTNRGNRPVNYVSWYDTLRFANWLHNGQPTGAQDNSTTEDGAYDMSLGSSVVRKPGATWFLSSEDEWYKAAYYKGGGTDAGYWDYATQSDTPPTAELPAGTDLTNGSANFYDGGYLDTTYYTTEVGVYTAKPSDSAYDTFDQNGNVSEWNEAVLHGGISRALRGGSALPIGPSLGSSSRWGHDPSWNNKHIGFRVASVLSVADPSDPSVPEPCSLVLLGLGGLVLRRRKS